MGNLRTANVIENEIIKQIDVESGFDSSLVNVALAIKAIVSSGKSNFVIGGKVKPYQAGGLNVSIEPIFAYEEESESCVIETNVTEPVTFEMADGALDRIDVIQVKPKLQKYDTQARAMNDPVTGAKSFEQVETKKKIVLEVSVKKGANGSPTAPLLDKGFVKLAEIVIPAGTNNISEDLIKNISAKKATQENTDWTVNKSDTFAPLFFAESVYNFLVSHLESGEHKNESIKAKNIAFGVEADKVKGELLPTGKNFTLRGANYVSTENVTNVLNAIVENINSIFPFINNVWGRFSFCTDFPVAASTENVDIEAGGTKTIDGVECKAGSLVFLKNQTNRVDNGFYTVQTGKWNRAKKYEVADNNAFDSKFIVVNAGTENKGSVFYLEAETGKIGTDELQFEKAFFSSEAKENNIVMRDNNGRAKINEPAEEKHISNKKYVDVEVKRNTGLSGLSFGLFGSRFIVFDFANDNHKSIKIKKGTHISLDNNGEEMWLDVEGADKSFDLSAKITEAARVATSRAGEANGRDFYLYLYPVEGGNTVDITVSTREDAPSDINNKWNENNTRKIGQFHTLCADVGDANCTIPAPKNSGEKTGNNYLIKNYDKSEIDFYNFYNKKIDEVTTRNSYDVLTVKHPLAGFTAGQILPESVWCLSFMPKSSANGMVYDVETDIAVDIYLQSGTGRKTRSEYKATTTDSREQQNHVDDMRQVRKRLLWDHEFSSIALGSNEKTNIKNSAKVNTTGGNKDTAYRRMISLIGVEDCCGLLWQWLNDVSANGGSGFTAYDGQGDFGQMYGTSYALLAGGVWDDGSLRGSRSRNADCVRSSAVSFIGGRGASQVLRYM